MGKSGVGKTSFYNKLCETEHEARYSSKSLTRQLFRSEVIHGMKRFTIIDTPGTDSTDEVFKHSFLLKEALTNEPINAIFVMIEFNSRCASALEEFDQSVAILKPEYRSMVVVIIAKFDKASANDVVEIQADYREQFAAEGFPNIMFYSSNDSAPNVAGKMIDLMSGKVQKSLVYEEKDFMEFFRVADESRALKKVIAGYEKNLDDIIKSYEALLPQLRQECDKDEIILSAIAWCRYDIGEIYTKFNNEHAVRMTDIECYTSSIQLHKIIEKRHRAFAQTAKAYMSYNPDDAADWRNCVRRCQHCREVWVKVSGCEGETLCGTLETAKDCRSGRSHMQYVFQWCEELGRRFVFKRSADTPSATSMSSGSTGSSSTEQKDNNKPKEKKTPVQQGCGRSIVWSEQPRVSDEDMQKLFQVKDLQNIITSMQEQSKGGYETLKKYQTTIDTSFTK
eukprot:TRINITY_DN123772_c0_g1_i1.p1 TRINITY_DN123772_c0_g1~~TRINITY_DN123772_c0_g1_i1.p1  ORF type:complete len:502 (+),score=96.72 TRINITY_DN123772_c0_g1_i1:155-1507(+)